MKMVQSGLTGRVTTIYIAIVRLVYSKIPATTYGLPGRALEENIRLLPSSVLTIKSCNLTTTKELVKLIVNSVMSV